MAAEGNGSVDGSVYVCDGNTDEGVRGTMTYPPQQPGPYGQDPYGRPPQQPPQSPPYGQQPPQYGGQPSPPYGQPQQQPPGQPPYGGQTSYQGLGSFGPGGAPPEPPQKRNTGMIVAIVLIVLLVVGGGGVAFFVLNKDDNKDNAGGGGTTTESSTGSEPEETESGSASTGEDEPTDSGGGGGGGGDLTNSPEDVRDAYMAAYESKSFGDVVDNACDAYKSQYGTDTSKLEQQLEGFTIVATADGDPQVSGTNARANIDLELSQSGNSETAKIFIKIVEEDGQWKFCGEGEA